MSTNPTAAGPVSGFAWNPDAVARTVLSCPGVVRLIGAPVRHKDRHRVPDGGAGAAAEVATYLPGRRVEGVRVRPDGILVQIVCRYGERLGELAARVRAAVLVVEPGCPRVDVVIRDLAIPDPDLSCPQGPDAAVVGPGTPRSGVPGAGVPGAGVPEMGVPEMGVP
ncbi:hypothetical protein CcI6DRAFT_00657 [Frankia sp. CcI6]|uniref:hypothetical protein n=1 Tax=Frankia TaxID=1854 RepID=UPI0003D05D4F|nr:MULTISPECIES: hypothetical protein [Frankia]ETA03821.1 hypothetical protein CcI6DRAFT_00657 [Frankia sp. CcI6]OAA26528.1 hypothetical protein AAY23_103126 [Frankia casuarinae]